MELKINLETEEFCCENALLQDVLDSLGYIYKQKTSNYASIAILCYEDLTEAIIKSLNVMCVVGDIDLEIDYIDFDKEDYDDEYGMVLAVEDGQLKLSVEKAYYDGSYTLFEVDYIYASEECDDELIAKNIKCEVDVFCITDECKEEYDFDDEEFECNGDCENCNSCEDEFVEEPIDLYDVVESMVESILDEKFTRR